MTQATNNRDTKMVHGAQYKTGYIRDTSIQPYRSRNETFEIRLPKGVRAVDVTVMLSYQPVPGRVMPIATVKRKVSIDL